MATTATQKWYNRTWLVITLSLLIFPFGLYGLWKNRQLQKAPKIIVSILSPVTTIIIMLIGIFLYSLAYGRIYEAEIRYAKATVKYYQKDYKEAIAAYDTLILKRPTFSDAYLMRGNSYDKMGNKRKAMIEYALAIQFDSTNAAAYFNRGLLKIELLNFQQAIDDFDHAIKFDSLSGEAFYFRGMAKGSISRLSEACKDFKAAQKLGRKEAADALKQYCN